MHLWKHILCTICRVALLSHKIKQRTKGTESPHYYSWAQYTDELNPFINILINQNYDIKHNWGFSSVQFSSVVSDSLRPHELQHARPPCPSKYQNEVSSFHLEGGLFEEKLGLSINIRAILSWDEEEPTVNCLLFFFHLA